MTEDTEIKYLKYVLGSENYAETALHDILVNAMGLFEFRPDLAEFTVERRGDGTAWIKLDGRWLTVANETITFSAENTE